MRQALYKLAQYNWITLHIQNVEIIYLEPFTFLYDTKIRMLEKGALVVTSTQNHRIIPIKHHLTIICIINVYKAGI